MLAPLSWLRDFAPLEGDVDFLVDNLNDLGLLVDGVERVGEGLDGVVVGRVLDVRAHPNADKVRLADVDLGDGQALQIACGASNLATGQIVAVATIGTVLPGNFEIGRRKMRGEWSNGMICSADELGLTKQRAPGILVLPDDLTIGAAFAEAMGIVPDVVFDLEIETNRPDAMCMSGVARDLAARLREPFAIPEPNVKESTVEVSTLASIGVEATDLCPRFVARVITDVTIGPSPETVARRLTMAGMRPINNVVDASNYVMLELGQPSHPFDLDKLPGRGLLTRWAREGDSLVTLDGVERKLTSRDGVVCDADDGIVSIAGIMGGSSSEISEKTTTVLSEAAVWSPYAINHTSRRLALRTDASARFERQVDRMGLERAQARICELIQQSSPNATVARGMLDANNTEPWPSSRERVRLRTARVNAVLGTSLDDEQIRERLEPIGFHVSSGQDGVSEVLIPSFRPDSDREIDVIEEIARMHGYENIPRRVPTASSAGHLTRYQKQRRALRALLSGLGITEAWTSPLTSSEELARTGLAAGAVSLVNPIVAEESKLRTSLLPTLMQAVAFNVTRRNVGVRLFEIGHTFRAPQDDSVLPDEREAIGIVLADGEDDALAASRLSRALARGLRLQGLYLQAATMAGMHPTRAAAIMTSDGRQVGVVGEVDPAVVAEYGLARRVGWIEADLRVALDLAESVPQIKSISRFPAAEFDLAFVVDDRLPAFDLQCILCQAVGDLCEDVRLFDVFRDERLGPDKRGLAYHLRIAALDRTLSDEEVSQVRQQAIDAVIATKYAELRG